MDFSLISRIADIVIAYHPSWTVVHILIQDGVAWIGPCHDEIWMSIDLFS